MALELEDQRTRIQILNILVLGIMILEIHSVNYEKSKKKSRRIRINIPALPVKNSDLVKCYSSRITQHQL